MARLPYAAGSVLLAISLAATLAGCTQKSTAPTVTSSVTVTPSAAVTVVTTTPGASRSSTPTPLARPTPALPTGATVRTLRAEVNAPSTGVELYPVAGPAPQVVAPATVYATMLFAGQPELTAHPSTIELATYRSSLNGGRIDLGDGASPQFVHSLLAWVIVYNGIAPVWPNLGGPYRPSGAPTPSPTPVPTHCQWVYLANAVTGKYVGAFGGCPGELRPARRR